jgi:predicted nucleotidyltransferase
MMPEKTAAALAAVCRRYGVRRLRLFGSMARGEDRPESDNDLLVEFEPQARKDFFTIGELSDELQTLMGGRRVDLVTSKSLNRFIRDYVEADLTSLYER